MFMVTELGKDAVKNQKNNKAILKYAYKVHAIITLYR